VSLYRWTVEFVLLNTCIANKSDYAENRPRMTRIGRISRIISVHIGLIGRIRGLFRFISSLRENSIERNPR